MSLFSVSMGLTVIGSLLFCWLSLRMVFRHNQRYKLPESKYTKLFGIITKQNLTVTYIVAVTGHAIFAIWFASTL